MPMRVSDLSVDSEEKAISVKFGENSLNLVYRVDKITPKSEGRLMDLARENRSGGALAEVLAAVVVSWDLENDKGEPYPVTIEALSELPILVLSAIFEAIQAAQRPNRKSGKR